MLRPNCCYIEMICTLQHNGKPYCDIPCYQALFGPGGFGRGGVGSYQYFECDQLPPMDPQQRYVCSDIYMYIVCVLCVCVCACVHACVCLCL